jgi:Ca2+-binding RTX toxin-like protein
VDTLNGGLGDDTFIIDATLVSGVVKLQDVANDTGGNDTLVLRSSGDLLPATPTTLTLATTLENFDISGTHASHINITGNAANNVMTGNDWDNTINGGAGADSMDGGNGNDTYILDNVNDFVSDTGNGNDTIVIAYAAPGANTEIDVDLYTGIENVKITGTGQFSILGDSHDNILTGNASANVMWGGDGNDTYFVGAGDDIHESPGEGTDTVMASVNWTLGGDFENLTLTGTALLGTGNSANNILTGDASANTLTGGGGNDTFIGLAGNDVMIGDSGNDHFDGGAGADKLTGGAGIDTFIFHHADAGSAANADTITDFDDAIAVGDVLDLSDVLTGYTSGPLGTFVHLTQSGLNTIVSVDIDGAANGTHFVNLVTLTGVTASTLIDADNLVATGHLIA